MDEWEINETPKAYEVGYGRPPKDHRFQKGISGNPKGRPKLPTGFDAALVREAQSRITINENGKPTRVSKHDVIIKQLINNAIKGKTCDVRLFCDIFQGAFGRENLLTAENHKYVLRVEDLTDDELLWIATHGADQKKLAEGLEAIKAQKIRERLDGNK